MSGAKPLRVLVALLACALASPVLGRGGGHGGGHSGGRSGAHSGAHAGTHHATPGRRAQPGRPLGVYLGAPLLASPYFYAPGFFLTPMPPIEYIEMEAPEGAYFRPPERDPADSWNQSSGAWPPLPSSY